jgi:arginine/ornithine transport system permease protein
MSGLPVDLALAWHSLPAMLRGLATTVLITFASLALGLIVAFPICFARMSRRRLLSWPAGAFVIFFRGAPILILLYLVYYGFGQIAAIRHGPLWIVFGNAFACAVIGLTLNHAAYMVEILRGSLEAVPAGLIEASAALGISPRDVFSWIRLPLALRYGVKAYHNEVVSFAKGTAVVSVITVTDLTAVANEVFEKTYDPFTPMLTAAALYWALTNLLRVAFRLLERRLNRHHVVEVRDERQAAAGAAELAAGRLRRAA